MADAVVPFVSSGSYPAREGNHVRPLIDGEPAFRRICEAIEAAERSVWATVTFMWPMFEMPDGRGSALDVLGRAAARGVDVRVIFWRPEAGSAWRTRNAFWGSPDQIAELETRAPGIKIRWDMAAPGFCQHQKSWIVDGDSAFVGGINLNPNSMACPTHCGDGQNHDAYVEIAGPSAVDVHHNFVQRWNEASERLHPDGRWEEGSDRDLPFPSVVPDSRGNAVVQIQRTTHAGQYRDGRATPGGAAFDILAGERAVYDQYCAAIEAARRSIYIENQYIAVQAIVDGLTGALRRGVEVVMLMPAEPDRLAQYVGEDQPGFFERWAALGAFENCTLAGIAGLGADGQRRPVYVHSKLMLVDDAWATIGSCNLHRFSLFGNSEMNASIWDGEVVRALRCELLREHLGVDTSGMDDRTALQAFRRVAVENRRRLASGDHAWQGLAFALDLASYGQ